MEYKITAHEDLTSLEFKLLEELSKLRVLESLITDDKEEERNKLFRVIQDRLSDITRVNQIFEAIQNRDDGVICKGSTDHINPFFFIKGSPYMEIGGMYFESNMGYTDKNFIIKINKELLDEKKSKEFFKEMDEWVEEVDEERYGRYSRRYEDLVKADTLLKGEINFEVIKDRFEGFKKERIEIEEEEEESRKSREEEKVTKENDEKITYETKGEGKFDRFSILGNIIKSPTDDYVLNKDVNKIFSYDEVKNKGMSDYVDTTLKVAELFLYEKKISYKKNRSSGGGYKVSYVGDKCKINDVNIPSSKVKFILNNICYKDKTNDEIIILIKLNGMKSDFVNLENLKIIYGDDMKIPIKNRAIDDKTFEIEFLSKKKTFDWDEIKELFYDRGRSRSIDSYFDYNKLLNFSETMGVEKKELFRIMKRIKMLNALEDEGNK